MTLSQVAWSLIYGSLQAVVATLWPEKSPTWNAIGIVLMCVGGYWLGLTDRDEAR
jgi:hypothetical protein